jgi:hypothetical protein
MEDTHKQHLLPEKNKCPGAADTFRAVTDPEE